MTKRTTRIAPSPTGALHLGNARTFLTNWAIARREGWTVLLRIEDLDGPRVKAESAAETIDTLQWLGLDHDGPVLYQSHDLNPYRAAMRTLADAGRIFACALTRREIQQAASAPHADEHELRYPQELRHARSCDGDSDVWRFVSEQTNYRLCVESESIVIDDTVFGSLTFNPSREVGDFVVWTRHGYPAYQLAVVVDDARQGVTDVVRGADLLPSAARQRLLYRALGLAEPTWWHLPLVIGPDGRRLAKRHGDSRIATYRKHGVEPHRIIGLLAKWSGIVDEPTDMTADEFRTRFDLSALSREPVTFTEDDHAWLLAGR